MRQDVRDFCRKNYGEPQNRSTQNRLNIDSLIEALREIQELAASHLDDTMSDYPAIHRIASNALKGSRP